MITFFANLYDYLLIVFLAGGSLSLSVNVYQWFSDMYEGARTDEWKATTDFKMYKIYPPTENQRSMAEMESFFINLSSIYEEISHKNRFVKGHSNLGISFEIHSDKGKIAYYIRISSWYEELLQISLDSHFDGARMVEVSDPTKDWPSTWSKNHPLFKDMFGADIDYTSHEAHPTKPWSNFQTKDNSPISDPISQLIGMMENIGPQDYAIFKMVSRPLANKKKIEEMEKELKDRKEEYLTNSAVSKDADGKIQLLTDQEKLTLNAIRVKIGSQLFKTKIRFAYFAHSLQKPGVYEGYIEAYFAQFSTFTQNLICSEKTKTNQDSKGEYSDQQKKENLILRLFLFFFSNPIFLSYVAKFLDFRYWQRERFFRKYKIYKSIRSTQNIDVGEAPKFMDTASLVAFFHFPMTHLNTNPIADRITTDYGEEADIGSTKPPSNLPM